MKLLSLQDAFAEFLEAPTAANFVIARELIIVEEDYDPHAKSLLELTQLIADGSDAEALGLVESLMPAWSLCPRVHFLAGCAADALGDDEEVELCRFLTSACMEGMLATGDGTQQRPYLVTYPSDIHDLLTSLGKTPRKQRVVQDGRSLLDAVFTAEGATLWFDVGDMVAAGAQLPQVAH